MRLLSNLICDESDGPRHVPFTAGGSTSVNADTTTGKISYNPTFFVFGQFSRFIRPVAKRIPCTSNSDDFIATAALNPDGVITVVVQNLRDHEIFFRVWRNGKSLRYTSPANAVMTFNFQPK